MRVLAYVYDSTQPASHVDRVLALIGAREESVDLIDVGSPDNRTAVQRDAMMTVKAAVRVGSPPAELYDDRGLPNFSEGALVTEEETGRRSLHVGPDALEVLRQSA